MPKTITIPIDEYEHLRRCVKVATAILEKVEVREYQAPDLSTDNHKKNEYRRKLSQI